MKNISVNELNEQILQKEELILIDIRERYEWETDHLPNCAWIRMQELPYRLNEIPKNKKVIILCRSGRRSEAVCHYLNTEKAYNNVWNLEGGLLQWKEKINPKFDIE
ncbi:MAG: rhodanese-like domain-containing protein [Flavobacteriia bacterium]|nr:rhodanese-like domain-containing protein [Flavobacteriia bacterium]